MSARECLGEKSDGYHDVPEALRPFLILQAENKAPSDFLFPARSGGPHCYGWVADQVKRICNRAKVDDITAHALRGMLADISIRNGAPGQIVAAALRREDIRTTKEAYSGPGAVEAGERKRALKAIAGGKK